MNSFAQTLPDTCLQTKSSDYPDFDAYLLQFWVSGITRSILDTYIQSESDWKLYPRNKLKHKESIEQRRQYEHKQMRAIYLLWSDYISSIKWKSDRLKIGFSIDGLMRLNFRGKHYAFYVDLTKSKIEFEGKKVKLRKWTENKFSQKKILIYTSDVSNIDNWDSNKHSIQVLFDYNKNYLTHDEIEAIEHLKTVIKMNSI